MGEKRLIDDVDFLEGKLQLLTTEQLSTRLDVSVNTLRWKIKELGIDVRQIKHDYTIRVLSELSGKLTFPQMAKKTGFSKQKIKQYAARYGIQSLIGYK